MQQILILYFDNKTINVMIKSEHTVCLSLKFLNLWLNCLVRTCIAWKKETCHVYSYQENIYHCVSSTSSFYHTIISFLFLNAFETVASSETHTYS